MNWIDVKTKLPKLFEVVWIYWRDREVLLGFRCEEENSTENNAEWGWYSFDDEKCK